MTYHDADPSAFDSEIVRHHGRARRGETMRTKTRLKTAMAAVIAMASFLCLTAGKAGAQFLQYTPPGGPEEPPESRKEDLERQISEANHHLGRVRIAPWATLRDISYVRNVFSTRPEATPDDYTATVGAGFRAYLRNGPKALWRAQVLPELVWWARQTDRRQLNGNYSLGFHGFFNRLTLEVQAGRQQHQQVVTPELPVPVSSRRDLAEVLAEVRISGALSAFTATSVTRQALVEDAGDPTIDRLAVLDREDRIARVGLRWRPREPWTIALGAERSETDFDRDVLDRSNAGTAPVAEVRYKGRRSSFGLNLASRSLEARRGAAFVPYDKVTGSAAATLGTTNRLSGTVYGSRNLLYALARDYAYLTDERTGFVLGVGVGRRSQVSFFVETGNNDYTAFQAATLPRREDVFSYGASVNLRLSRQVSIGVQALRSEFDSNLPNDDRSYTSVGTTVNLFGATLGPR